MSKGYVYVLFNPSIPNLVKIGRTTDSSEARAAVISRGTGVPTPFQVICEELVPDCHTAEKRIHAQLKKHRHSPRREFFRIPIKEAVQIVQHIATELQYPTYLIPEITSVKILHRKGACFLEVVSRRNADELIERIDLGFIGAGEKMMFLPSRTAQENADLFVNSLDAYSIIMCTPLFTEAACREIDRQANDW